MTRYRPVAGAEYEAERMGPDELTIWPKRNGERIRVPAGHGSHGAYEWLAYHSWDEAVAAGLLEVVPEPERTDVGEIMDKAAHADRRALFAALQAALGVIIDLHHGHSTATVGCLRDDPYARVMEALELGAEIGSPEHMARMKAPVAATYAEADGPRHAGDIARERGWPEAPDWQEQVGLITGRPIGPPEGWDT